MEVRIICKIVVFDDFANDCKHLYTEEGKEYINNGYHCKHEDQKWKEEFFLGCCFSWTCPLGHEAEKEDFKDENIDNNGFEQYEYGLFVMY